jgi:hypothetical protein
MRDNREIADKLAVHEIQREAEGPASASDGCKETSLTHFLIIASAMASRRMQPIQ